MSNIDEVIEGSHQYFPASKFAKAGVTLVGDVLDAWIQPKRKYGSTEIDTWDDGSPKEQLVVNWVVKGEKQTLYTKPPAQRAIFDAVKASGGRLSQGGTLTVSRVEDGVPSQKGYNAPQQFEAEFEPTAATGSDLDEV